MSVLVNTKNEQEEKVLLAFLDSLHYKYQSDIEDEANQIKAAFLNQTYIKRRNYNRVQ